MVQDSGITGTVTRRATPGILNCTEMRPFWVRWKDGRVMFGTGSSPGENVVVDCEDAFPHPVNAITISTKSESNDPGTGRWEFVPQWGNIKVFTLLFQCTIFILIGGNSGTDVKITNNDIHIKSLMYKLYISDRTEPPALTDNGNFRKILVIIRLHQ